MADGWRLSVKGAAAALALIAVIIYALSVILRVNIASVISRIPPWVVAACASSYLAGEAVRAARLRMLVEDMAGCKASVAGCLTARLSGNLVALLTPSIGGGEAVRGALSCPSMAGRSAVVGVLDGGIDLLANYILAAAGVPVLLALQGPGVAGLLAPGLLLAAPVFAAWSLALGSRRVFRAVMTRAERLPLVSRWLKGIASIPPPPSLPPRRRAAVAVLSLAGWVFNYLEAVPLALILCSQPPSARGFIGFVASFLAGVLPTPGGVGTVDYYMSFFICSPAVVAWRVLRTIYIAVLGAAASLPAAGKLVKGHDE